MCSIKHITTFNIIIIVVVVMLWLACGAAAAAAAAGIIIAIITIRYAYLTNDRKKRSSNITRTE